MNSVEPADAALATPLPRRACLARLATGGAAVLLGTAARSTARADDTPRAPVVDTHLHCFAGRGDARFPYHAQGPYQPEKAATPERLLECMAGAGVDYAVVVHPEPYQDDHRYLEHCLQVGGKRLKGTCLFFAGRDGALDNLAALVRKHPGKIVAARVHAYAPDRLPPFGTNELRALWKAASDLGLAMQLHFEPRYAEGFLPYIRDFPKTTVIIDHLGRPLQGTPAEHDAVVKWAGNPNTVMKISSLPDVSKYPHRDIRPIVRKLADAWGADRLIYGGGFDENATPDSYRAYRDRVAALLDHFNASDRAKVLGGNAAKLFGFTPVS